MFFQEDLKATRVVAHATPIIIRRKKDPAYIVGIQYKLKNKTDDALLRRLSELVKQSRVVEVELVAPIGEVDARRLYAREAVPLMFAYCTKVLRLSEHESYLRIQVARAARKHPMLLDMLSDGRLLLSGIVRLAPLLTEDNRDSILACAVEMTKRQIEELVAELSPKPDVPAAIRKLPERPDRTKASPLRQLVPERVEMSKTLPAPIPRSAVVAP